MAIQFARGIIELVLSAAIGQNFKQNKFMVMLESLVSEPQFIHHCVNDTTRNSESMIFNSNTD